jgi:SPX domain protein involved in polyphosphate accumulation
MNPDRLRIQRFELKFQVPEAVAQKIRQFIRPYVKPDGFAANLAIPAYPVHSLYLDSGDFHTYRSTVNGDADRFKLRVRYYDESPKSPVFLEIKRRVDRCIVKQRARVRRECVAELLSGAWPGAQHLHPSAASDLPDLREFCRLLRALNARPRARVSYNREAWVGEGSEPVRVTMDRRIQCEPESRPTLSTQYRNPVEPFAEVVIELKFSSYFPEWLQHMVRRFNLVQIGAAKYVEGVTLLGPDRFRETVPALPARAPARAPVPVVVPAPARRPERPLAPALLPSVALVA